jgi:hypothetical protein
MHFTKLTLLARLKTLAISARAVGEVENGLVVLSIQTTDDGTLVTYL